MLAINMTRGTKSQEKAKRDLFSSLETACRIYAPAREMCKFDYESFDETTYHPNVAAKIIGLSFLSAVAAWEDFLSQIYLGYLSGYPSPNGYLPDLVSGKARNKSHALLLASGACNPREAERRMKWNNIRWIKSISKIHFKKKNPFEEINEIDIKWLEMAVVIRNRVAHNSDKAKVAFKDAVNRLFKEKKGTPLPTGFSPGQLLIVHIQPYSQLNYLETDECFWGDVFEGYISLFKRLANKICPG